MSAANSTTTCFLGLGSDCGVLFVQNSNLNQSSVVKAAQTRHRGCAQRGHPTAVSSGVDVGSWWLGRVEKFRRRVGNKWGLCRNPVDLMSRTAASKIEGKFWTLHRNYVELVQKNVGEEQIQV